MKPTKDEKCYQVVPDPEVMGGYICRAPAADGPCGAKVEQAWEKVTPTGGVGIAAIDKGTPPALRFESKCKRGHCVVNIQPVTPRSK